MVTFVGDAMVAVIDFAVSLMTLAFYESGVTVGSHIVTY